VNESRFHDVERLFKILSILFLITLPTTKALAEEVLTQETLIFTAPPRESVQKGNYTYEPIASYLSKVLGKNIEYQHPGNWLTYSADMRKDKFDIVFDGPHFVSWRISKINHTPIVKIPGGFIFKFVAYRDNKKILTLNDLVGKRVCGHAPPNQGTLRLFNQFRNPMRLPILVPKKGWRNIYSAMMSGKCDAAILPEKIYKKVDPEKKNSKVLFSSDPVSGQAITVSKKFTPRDVITIRNALLSEQGRQATENLRKRFASPKLVPANKQEYEGVSSLLVDSYGFGDQLF